jgi:hypothetical protein
MCWTDWFSQTSLHVVFTANSRLVKVVSVKFAAWPHVCAVLCETTKQAVNLSVHQDGRRPSTGIQEIMETEASTTEIWISCHHKIWISCHHKHPEAAAVVQQVHKVFNDTEILARCTPAKVEESSECTSNVNSVEVNTANICKGLDGKLLFSTLYGMYTVTLYELKAIHKMSAQAGAKWCSEQNLSGINNPEWQLPES